MIGDLLLTELQHFLWRIGELEERAGGAVDALVRRLRGEHDGDEQRVRVRVFQFRFRIGTHVREAGVELFRFGFGQALSHVFSSLGSRSGWSKLSA